MKRILVIGSTGQIGSELTVRLRELYGRDNVVAGYIEDQKNGVLPEYNDGSRSKPRGELEEGPKALADVTDGEGLARVVKTHKVDAIFNLAALLSVVAERKPRMAWHIGVDGLVNVLEVAKENGCAVFTPSSIGAFGPGTPKDKTPQDTLQRPTTIYGISKVTGELLSDYYYHKYGVDTRSVRFPGLISYVTPPGGGTTDYAVDIYHSAARGEKFCCPLKPGTFLDMMYMPDALRACVSLMEADPKRLKHRNSFNVTAMSFDPEGICQAIKVERPHFEMEYRIDEQKQAIADSWPNSLDDHCAREEWDWQPHYDLTSMTRDILLRLTS